MRVLHLIPSLEVGGSERLLFDLATSSRGADHVVVTMLDGGALVPSFRKAGVHTGRGIQDQRNLSPFVLHKWLRSRDHQQQQNQQLQQEQRR